MTPFAHATSAFAKRGYHSAFGYGGGWHPWRRTPSRILWFVLGAGSAALYIKHKDSDLRKSYGSRCRRIGPEHMTMDGSAAVQGGTPAPAASVHAHWGTSQYPLPHPAAPGWNAPGERAAGETSPQPPLQALKSAFDGWEKNQDQRIEEEKEHMAKVSRQAVDAVRPFVIRFYGHFA